MESGGSSSVRVEYPTLLVVANNLFRVDEAPILRIVSPAHFLSLAPLLILDRRLDVESLATVTSQTNWNDGGLKSGIKDI